MEPGVKEVYVRLAVLDVLDDAAAEVVDEEAVADEEAADEEAVADKEAVDKETAADEDEEAADEEVAADEELEESVELGSLEELGKLTELEGLELVLNSKVVCADDVLINAAVLDSDGEDVGDSVLSTC